MSAPFDSVTKAFAEVRTKTNVVDILINNAAVGSIGTVETESEENWEKIFNINVFSVARVTKAALPLLRKSKVPAIVNTCSIRSYSWNSQSHCLFGIKGCYPHHDLLDGL